MVETQPTAEELPSLRAQLYDQYLSTFKGDPRKTVNVKKFHAWCDFRIKPWLTNLSVEQPRFLDLGCGPGYILGYLKHLGFQHASGIDLSDEQVEIGRSLGHDCFVADAFEYLGANVCSFDVIIAFDFVEHFTKEELPDLLKAIHRSLRPGGRLLLQTPNGSGLFTGHIVYGDLSHSTIFTPGSLQQILSLCGYGDFHWNETGPVPLTFIGVLRTIAWQLVRHVANGLNKIATGRSQRLWTDNMLCWAVKKDGVEF